MWVKLLWTATSWRSYTTLQLTRYSLQLLLKQQSVSTSWQRNTTTYGACLHLVIHCVNSEADGQAQLIQLHSNQFTQTLTDSYTSSCQSQSISLIILTVVLQLPPSICSTRQSLETTFSSQYATNNLKSLKETRRTNTTPTQQPPFYGHCTGQPALAGTYTSELEDFHQRTLEGRGTNPFVSQWLN